MREGAAVTVCSLDIGVEQSVSYLGHVLKGGFCQQNKLSPLLWLKSFFNLSYFRNRVFSGERGQGEQKEFFQIYGG